MTRLIYAVFGILVLLAAPAFGQATGNKWIHYETETCDSILLILQDSSGVDTVKKVTSTGLIDSLFDCDSLMLGVNTWTAVFYDVGDTTPRTSSESFNNTKSGGLKAVGDLHIGYSTDLLDSLMFIHEYEGTLDTVVLTAVNGIDTTMVAESLSTGVHNFVIRFLYSGEEVWLSASETFHNTRSILAEGVSEHLCWVYGNVYGVDGRPVKGVEVRATLARHPTHTVIDTCSHLFVGNYSPDKVVTDSNGLFQIRVTRSKCFNTGGLYNFVLKNTRTGMSSMVTDSVPDSAYYRLNLMRP